MRSGFARLTGSSRVTGSARVTPPPSYRSNSVRESDAGSIVSWRSNLTEAEIRDATAHPTPTFRPTSPVVVMEAPAVGRNQATSKFLKINYDGKSVLIMRPEKFEDMIEMVREMFSLPDTTPLFASADVPSFDNERMLLHRGVWPVISSEISVVWISDSADSGINRSATDRVRARATQLEDPVATEPASPKETVSHRLSTRISTLFTPKVKDSKREDLAPVTENVPKIDEPAPVAPLAVEEPEEPVPAVAAAA